MANATDSITDERAIGRGLIAAPFAAAVVGFLLPIWSFGPGRTIGYPIQAALVMAVLFGLSGTLITMCVAYPLALLLRKRGAVNLVTAIVSGAVLGNVPAAIGIIGTLITTGSVYLGGFMLASAVGSTAGIAAAGAFWMLARPHFARRA
jgi:hypothetical protein